MINGIAPGTFSKKFEDELYEKILAYNKMTDKMEKAFRSVMERIDKHNKSIAPNNEALKNGYIINVSSAEELLATPVNTGEITEKMK